MTLTDELIEHIYQLDAVQQQRLLNFARVLARTPAIRGEAGESIVRAIGFFDAQALDEIEAAINRGYAEIDPREWE
jgi:hypothetical protein